MELDQCWWVSLEVQDTQYIMLLSIIQMISYECNAKQAKRASSLQVGMLCWDLHDANPTH